jgi:hypothetical protein
MAQSFYASAMPKLSRSCLAVMVLIATLAMSGCMSGKSSADLHGYEAGPGSDQVTVFYTTGLNDGGGQVEVLEQGSAHVKVRVLYERSDGVQDLAGVIKHGVSTLTSPLGDRKLLDEAGHEVSSQWRPVSSR